MRKWFVSKEGKKITTIIMILCVLVVVQIIGSLHFNRKLYNISVQHSTDQIEELSTYVENNFQLELEHYIRILKVSASQLEKEGELYLTNIVDKLQTIQEFSKFKMIGVADLDGNGIDGTGNQYHISYECLQEYIKKDQVYISNVLKNENEILIFIAVPLKVNDEFVGVVWGKIPLAEIINHIEIAGDSYKYFQIIDQKGNYLFSSESKFALNQDLREKEETIWEELENYQYENGLTVEKIQESISKGKSGHFYLRGDEHGCYISYQPLKINNWYLLSIQVEDELHAYVNHTRTIVVDFFIVLIIILIVIFVILYNLIYTMYQNITKQHHEIGMINAMFQETLRQTNNIPFTIEKEKQQIILYGYPTNDVVQYCSFRDMRPEDMLKKGIIDTNNLESYQKLYQSVIVQEQACEPVILYLRMRDKREWVRVSIISDTQQQEGQMIGVLESYSEQKEKDLQIENHLDDIKKIEQKSQMDFLTGLYNREAFINRVETILKENHDSQQIDAFLILDLDHFKEVNDYMGHGMGDSVLQKTAETLTNFFRKKDTVGRLGGDEFVVFAQNIQNLQAFEQRIKKLNALLYREYSKNGHSVQVSASIGIMLTDSEHLTFNSLYENADKALYKVKQAGRNGYQIYFAHK